LGQLLRERHREAAVLVGFTTFQGHVTAASEWGGAAERKQVRDALRGSYEALFHQVAIPAFLVVPRASEELQALLSVERLHRAIGVIYRPQSERLSHYYHTRISEQFDAILHVDRTRAVEPLEPVARRDRG